MNGSGNLTASGVVKGASASFSGGVNASEFDSGYRLLIGNGVNRNMFVGPDAGFSNPSGTSNSFFGTVAGASTTTGIQNTFAGDSSGYGNTKGSFNSFFGNAAGAFNTEGNGNSFFGFNAGQSNTTESNNTFIGASSTGKAGITNATAVGSQAQVTQSNSLVLGSINGVNGAAADTFVGIGTTAPGTKLHVVNSDFRVARLEGSSTIGTWLELNNTSAGGHNWAILSSGNGNGEGAGNLVLIDQTGSGQVVIDDNLKVPSCTGCTNAPSDHNLKANFALVDGRTILSKLAGIAIQSWNYKSEGAGVRHIGPMAQDFHAAFAVGTDDKHINTVDEGGVALAAIQELYREDLAKDKQIEDLKASNAALEKRLTALESAMEKLAKK